MKEIFLNQFDAHEVANSTVLALLGKSLLVEEKKQLFGVLPQK
jgi:hypothetical protein